MPIIKDKSSKDPSRKVNVAMGSDKSIFKTSN